MDQHCYEVPPLGRKQIIEAAGNLRRALRITEPWFPILHVVEVLLPREIPEFSFEVKEEEEMGNNHGLTRPELHEMWIRGDVYAGAYAGNGRDRFTIAHELGHYLLHNQEGLARKLTSAANLKPFRNSEWQANSFAGALLIPANVAIALRDPYEIAEKCGVSVDAANVTLKVLRQQGMLR